MSVYSSVNIRIECRSAADNIFREILFIFGETKAKYFMRIACSWYALPYSVSYIKEGGKYDMSSAALIRWRFRLLPG